MRLLNKVLARRAWVPSDGTADLARARRDTLSEAAVTLAATGPDVTVDPLLHVAAEAAARITGAATAIVLTRDGLVDRFVAHGLDDCTQEAFAEPAVLRPLARRLRALRRPLGADDLDAGVARALTAIAPHGLLVVPIEEIGFLVLVCQPGMAAIDEDAVAIVGVLARLTGAALERVSATLSMRASCDELRRLCTDVLARQDSEHGDMARELHEGICQRLAAANAQLEALGVLLDSQRSALARLRDARALLNQTLGELRELAQRLRPSVLENLGYVEALRWYLGRLRERAGVALSFEVEGAETRLPADVENALYHVTAAALGPAGDARGPRRLRVRYRREAETVRIEIAGPAPDAVDLVAIRERLRPFGGAVHVSAPPDRPPVIRVEVPARLN